MSCAEIRRLFWAVVVAVPHSATQLVRWSQWRRWHQAWARYYHYRRRDVGVDQPESERTAPAAPTLELVWQRLEGILPTGRRVGRPYAYSRRVVLEAILYVMQTGCGWRALPASFPPWQTVYTQLVEWQKSGVWAMLWAGLDQPQIHT